MERTIRYMWMFHCEKCDLKFTDHTFVDVQFNPMSMERIQCRRCKYYEISIVAVDKVVK